MIKKISIFLLTICILTLLIGCGKAEKEYGVSPKNPQEIEIWHYYNGAQAVAFEELVNEFNATAGLERGIMVTAKSKSGVEDLAQALESSLRKRVGAEKLPDIAQCYADTAVRLDQKKILVNLDTYISKEKKSEYMDSYIEEGTLGNDSEWKLFPVAKSTEVMLLNKTDWDTFSKETGAKIEELSTWEGVAKVAEEYYEWSGGKSFFGRDAFANYMLVGSKQLGHEIIEEKNGEMKIELDKTTMRRLWDNYYVPYVKGYYSHTGAYRTDDIKLGKLIAAVSSTTGYVYFPPEVSYKDNEPYPITCEVLPVPNFEGCSPYVIQQGASMAVIKSTESKEYASVIFLQWLAESERNTEFAIQTGYLPVKKEANSEKAITTYMNKNKTEYTSLDRAVLLNAISEIEGSRLYTMPGFLKSYDVRTILNTSMLERAEKDYEEIRARMANGKNREEVLQEYVSEEHFEEWYAALNQTLVAIGTN